MSNLFMDPESGNNANDASSFANRVKGFNNGITAARTAPGDTIRIKSARTGSLSGCSITADATTLTLPSGNHKFLTACDSTTGWTFAANITGAASTTRWEGTNSVGFTPASGFTTGQIGYFDLGADTDLSAFSAIHCAIDCGTVAQTITLKLCSDTSATVVVATLTYDGKIAATGFHSALFKNGAALPSNVRTLSFEVSADPVTTILRIDAIAACHDPAVTPNSITPWSAFSTDQSVANNLSTANDCSFQGIRHFLTDTTATLLGAGTSGTQTGCGWPHATVSSGTLYVWHGEQNDRLELSSNNTVNTILEAGTAEAVSVYEGGYNRTDMSTQDTNGMSVFVISNFIGAFVLMKNYTELRRCIFIGNGGAGATPFAFAKIKDCSVIGVSAAPAQIGSTAAADCIFENVQLAGTSNSTALTIFSGDRSKMIGAKLTNMQPSFSLGEGLQLEDIWVRRSSTYGMIFTGGSCRQGYNARKINVARATTADLRCATAGVSVKIWDATLAGSTKISTTAGCIMVQNYGGDTAAVLGSANGFAISRDTETVDGTAASSLRLLINSSSYSTLYPLYWEGPLYRHPSSINGASVTVSLRVKKSHATNISGRLKVKRGVILASDATADIADNTNWQTVSVNFTPTADGPIEVYFELWSTATTESIYVNPESLTVTVN